MDRCPCLFENFGSSFLSLEWVKLESLNLVHMLKTASSTVADSPTSLVVAYEQTTAKGT